MWSQYPLELKKKKSNIVYISIKYLKTTIKNFVLFIYSSKLDLLTLKIPKSISSSFYNI